MTKLNIDVALSMLFAILNNVRVNFVGQDIS